MTWFLVGFAVLVLAAFVFNPWRDTPPLVEDRDYEKEDRYWAPQDKHL